MKRLLILLPLLLVGCTSNKDDKVYKNVLYEYNIDKHCYIVETENSKYNVPPSKYYEITLYSWLITQEQSLIKNEYFVKTNELFVYYIR